MSLPALTNVRQPPPQSKKEFSELMFRAAQLNETLLRCRLLLPAAESSHASRRSAIASDRPAGRRRRSTQSGSACIVPRLILAKDHPPPAGCTIRGGAHLLTDSVVILAADAKIAPPSAVSKKCLV